MKPKHRGGRGPSRSLVIRIMSVLFGLILLTGAYETGRLLGFQDGAMAGRAEREKEVIAMVDNTLFDGELVWREKKYVIMEAPPNGVGRLVWMSPKGWYQVPVLPDEFPKRALENGLAP